MSDATDYPLIDGGEDGYIEERAWVPVAFAATGEEAVQWITSRHDYCVDALAEDGMKLVATGNRSWHVQSACAMCDGTGADEYSYEGPVPVCPFPACEWCGGTGEQSPDADFVSWEKCEPGTPGAVEFWDLEVTEA